MALNTTHGVFSRKMFHQDIYDTGKGHSGPHRKKMHDEWKDWNRILKEDEEILPIIIAIGSDI